MAILKNYISTEQIEGHLRSYLQETSKRLGQETLSENWPNWIHSEAKARLKNIHNAKTRAKQALEKAQLLKTYKTSSTITKHFRENSGSKSIYVALVKGYIFIQKVREIIKKEKVNYLIQFNGQKKQSVGLFTLSDIIPTLTLALNKDGDFRLQIGNASGIQKLQKNLQLSNDNKLIPELEKSLINLTKQIYKVKEKSLKEGQWIYGMGGIAFESAARKLAKASSLQEIEVTVDDFQKDTQVFYKAGDMSASEVTAMFKLFKQEVTNMALELKRVSTKDNTVGAGLAQAKTIEHALEQIRDATKNPLTLKEANESLKKLFSSKEDLIVEMSAAAAQKSIEEVLSTIKI